MKNIFFVTLVCALGTPSLFALEAAPIRISIAAPEVSKMGENCTKKNTKTYGLDIGLFTAFTCIVKGVQVAPGAEAGNLSGLQIGGIASFVEYGYGVQLGGLFTSAHHKYSGIQVASIINIAVYSFKGAQLGAINYSGPATGLQTGFINIQEDGCPGPLVQVGGFNTNEALKGFQIGIGNSRHSFPESKNNWAAQLGIYNYSAGIRGFQLGIINRAEKLIGVQIGLVNIVSAKYRKLKVPLMPIINASW